MKIDTDELSYLFNDANSIVRSRDAAELYELLTADDVNHRIQAACYMARPTPERIEAVRQMVWGGYESKIGRA